ncbi:ATP:cob(I)alamin adenosyltransferase [Candidatus Woesearchaeota archaeon CG10_big_fil_rev_8_21_14_0_10_37_12]|nr:MAG: ATP:cob(I)alamin adenosyltransferase [Candidatus Woesearchaeota archaeon CG10_big_fil_rev_8_21_14_0_10_37_12]
MSIATKTGDKGETSLLGGTRVSKYDIRIEAYGTVDELNAAIGVALCYVESPGVKDTLYQIQHDLFTIGAELAALATQISKTPKITEKHLNNVEQAIERVESMLPKQTEFILPKGTKGATQLHLARTICRRAERKVVACKEHYAINPDIVKYLNRLSDLLFLFARKENQGKDEEKGVRY